MLNCSWIPWYLFHGGTWERRFFLKKNLAREDAKMEGSCMLLDPFSNFFSSLSKKLPLSLSLSLIGLTLSSSIPEPHVQPSRCIFPMRIGVVVTAVLLVTLFTTAACFPSLPPLCMHVGSTHACYSFTQHTCMLFIPFPTFSFSL